MGGSPVPQSGNSTVTNQTVIDPQLKGMILDNNNLAKLLTSGILPQMRAGSGGSNTGGVNYNDPSQGGRLSGYDENGMPVYMNPNAPTGQTSSSVDPKDYVNADGTPYTPPTSLTADFTPEQIQAFQALMGIGGTAMTPEQLGSGVYKNASTFKPDQITAPMQAWSGYDPTMASSPSIYNPATYDPTSTRSSSFTNLDFNKYLDPLTAGVVDPIRDYVTEMGDRGVASTLSKGVLGSAVRGSNNDLREAQIRGETTLQGGQAISQALQGAMQSAAGLASRDLNSMDAASQFNAGAANSAGQFNAASANTASGQDFAGKLQTALTNAGASNNASAFNAGAVNNAFEGNATRTLDALKSNQSAGIQGQGINMAGASGLANAILGSRNTNIQNAQLIGGVGDAKQALAQSKINDPFKALQIVSGAATGSLPAMSGSTSNTATSSLGGNSGGALSGLGGAAAGAGIAAALPTAFMAANPWMWPLLIAGGAGAGLLS
jgi:hypothetical protein